MVKGKKKTPHGNRRPPEKKKESEKGLMEPTWQDVQAHTKPADQFQAMIRYAQHHGGKLPAPTVGTQVWFDGNGQTYSCRICECDIRSDLKNHRKSRSHLAKYHQRCVSDQADILPLELAGGITLLQGRTGSPYFEWYKCTMEKAEVPTLSPYVFCSLCGGEHHKITQQSCRDHANKRHTDALASATEEQVHAFLLSLVKIMKQTYFRRSFLVTGAEPMVHITEDEEKKIHITVHEKSVHLYREWYGQHSEKRASRTILPAHQPRVTTRMIKNDDGGYRVEAPMLEHTLPKNHDVITCELCHKAVALHTFLGEHHQSQKHQEAWQRGIRRAAYGAQIQAYVGLLPTGHTEEDPLAVRYQQRHKPVFLSTLDNFKMWESMRTSQPVRIRQPVRTVLHHPAYPPVPVQVVYT